MFFFFNQKTAYEVRISDWSSDVCSSDLVLRGVAMQRRSAFVAAQTERLAGLVEASPYLPVIVRGDWRIEASERLGRWLGLDSGVRNFDELGGMGPGAATGGLDREGQIGRAHV